MNERIKQLAEQAKEETDALWAKLTPQEFKDTYNQKFAELIVERLCYDMIDVCGATQAERIQFVAKNWGVEL